VSIYDRESSTGHVGSKCDKILGGYHNKLNSFSGEHRPSYLMAYGEYAWPHAAVLQTGSYIADSTIQTLHVPVLQTI